MSRFAFRLQVHPSALLVFVLVLLADRAAGFGGAARFGLVVLGSVLVHELGHALVAGALGLGPSTILLHGFGGLTSFSRRPTHPQGVGVGLAGPGAGLLLGFGALALLLVRPYSPILRLLVAINLFWSLFNLLPMVPLDGGQVLWHLLAGLANPRLARAVTRYVSLALALAVGIYGLWSGWWFLLLISLLVARRNL